MNKEEKITISVNEEDVQNIINAYEKDIEYINQLEKELEQLKEIEKEHQKINGNLRVEIKELEKENQELKDRIDKAVEYIEKHTENIDRGKYYEDYVETYYLLKILKGDKE